MASFRHRQLPVQQENAGLSRLRNEVKHPKGLALIGQLSLVIGAPQSGSSIKEGEICHGMET
jgi:hypothetical protein